jgi:hypothetical protein
VRVVEAERERGSAGAGGLRAPDLGGAPPHHLRVRPALPPRRARVVAVVVELALRHPRRHHLARVRPVARPPLVRAARAAAHVRERAPTLPPVHLPRRDSQVRAPAKRGNAHRRARLVVRREVLIRRRVVGCCGGRTTRRQDARTVGRRGDESKEEGEEAQRGHGDGELVAGGATT